MRKLLVVAAVAVLAVLLLPGWLLAGESGHVQMSTVAGGYPQEEADPPWLTVALVGLFFIGAAVVAALRMGRR